MEYKTTITVHIGPKKDPYKILRFKDWKKKQEQRCIIARPSAQLFYPQKIKSLTVNITTNKNK